MHDLHPAARQLVTLIERVDDSQLDAAHALPRLHRRRPARPHRPGDRRVHRGRAEGARHQRVSHHRSDRATTSPSDWRTRIPADADALVVAWSAEDAWDGTTMIVGVEMPATVVGAVGINELVTHAWDLARAIGQPFDVDRDTVVACMEFVGPMSEPGAEGRRAPAFGPVVTPADHASPLERLIALTGRDPEWSSPS